MDGRSPSGFTNSSYCGLYCSPAQPPAPAPGPATINPQTVKMKSLIDVFTQSKGIGTFFAIIWYNPWVLFVLFSFW